MARSDRVESMGGGAPSGIGRAAASRNVKVVPASKDTQGKMDAIRTKEGLARQEADRINRSLNRLREKTGVAVQDYSRAAAKPKAPVTNHQPRIGGHAN